MENIFGIEEEKVVDLKEVISNRAEDLKFTNIIKTANDIAEHSTDYNLEAIGTHNLQYTDFGELTYVPDGGSIHNPLTKDISRYALGQLCGKIGVPANYIVKCVDNGYGGLAKENMNTWIDNFGKNLFLREHAGRIRGVFSDRYSVFDSHQILDVLGNTMDFSKFKLKGSLINDERLHLRMIDRKPLEILDGDKENPDMQDLFTGVTIDSSDVGRKVLSVKFFIYKQVCTNGMVVSKFGGTVFSQRHQGITSDEFQRGLIAGLDLTAELRDNAIELIKESKKEASPYTKGVIYSKEDMEALILSISKSNEMSKEAAEKVISLMDHRYNRSMWGYYNAITEVSQDYTLDRRLELETLAGDMLFA